MTKTLGPLHNSHFTALRRCKKKFSYAFIEGIQPKQPALPLARGIWIHYMLQAQFLKWGIDEGTLLEVPESINVDGVGEVFIVTYHPEDGPYLEIRYEDGTTSFPLSASGMLRLLTQKVWSRLFDEEKEKYTEDDHTLPEACKRILTEYFYYWRDHFNNRDFKVLLVEAAWSREYKGVLREGRVDYIIENKRGQIIVGDWKSTKNQPHPEYKFMESQLHLYAWGVVPLLREYQVPESKLKNIAVEFDYLSTKLPTIPSLNKDGSLSKRKINTTRLTLINFLNENKLKWSPEQVDEYLDKTEKVFFERKTMPRNQRVTTTLLDQDLADVPDITRLLENPETASRTVTIRCDWDCDFIELCKNELYGNDVRHIRKTQFEARSNSHAGVVDKDAE